MEPLPKICSSSPDTGSRKDVVADTLNSTKTKGLTTQRKEEKREPEDVSGNEECDIIRSNKKITLVDMRDCDFTKKSASRPKQPRDQKLKLKNTTVDENLRKAEFKT